MKNEQNKLHFQISWESTTLGFWYTELLERNAQFRTWISTDRPKVSVWEKRERATRQVANCF